MSDLFFLLLVTACLMTSVCSSYSGKVLLVSMDGFRWDYLKNFSGLGNFSRLASSGVSVDYVNNAFVTKTFPCHYTIVTGLYEESHGIIANAMYDRDRNASFSMSSKESFWWDGGEPIWVTAVKQGKKAATMFWPGSEAEIRGTRPTVWLPYNESKPFPERVQTVIGWFKEQSMDLATLYFHEPDSTGHKYGPESQEVIAKVQEMDGILGLILKTIEENGLSDVINVIVTSDHGMTSINPKAQIVDLWSAINKTMVERVVESGILTAILPVPGQEAEVVAKLKNLSHVQVYRKEDFPEHFHYKNNPRVMPVLVLTDEGWEVTTNITATRLRTDKGNHGYSNELQSMKPIFLGRGPNFRSGVNATSISSVDIYPLLCELLGIKAAPNNGSLGNMMKFLVASNESSTAAAASKYLNVFLLGLDFLALECCIYFWFRFD